MTYFGARGLVARACVSSSKRWPRGGHGMCWSPRSGSTNRVTILHGSIANRGGSDRDRLGIARFDGQGDRLREVDWA
jgi:hypothetical protein